MKLIVSSGTDNVAVFKNKQMCIDDCGWLISTYFITVKLKDTEIFKEIGILINLFIK